MTGVLVVCLNSVKDVRCLMIGSLLCAIDVDKVIFLGVAHSKAGNPHIRETSFPWGGHPAPKGNIKGKYSDQF